MISFLLCDTDDKNYSPKSCCEPVKGTVSASDGAGINVELVLMLKSIKPMRVARDENVNIELSLNHGKTFSVTPRHNLMPVTKADTKVAHSHYLLLRVIEIL